MRTKTLVLPAPNLVKIKRSSDVPDCPKVPSTSTSGSTLSSQRGSHQADLPRS